MTMQTITVLFFANLRESTGSRRASLEIPEGMKVAELNTFLGEAVQLTLAAEDAAVESNRHPPDARLNVVLHLTGAGRADVCAAAAAHALLFVVARRTPELVGNDGLCGGELGGVGPLDEGRNGFLQLAEFWGSHHLSSLSAASAYRSRRP